MQDVSGVKWAVPGAHVGLYGPLLGRQDTVPTPEGFQPTPSATPGVSDESAPEEVPDAGPEPPQ